MVGAGPRASVGGVGGVPGLGVHGADLLAGVAVLHEHVGVVELAGLEGAVGGGVGAVVVALGGAGGGAEGGVKGSGGEGLDAQVGVDGVAERGVDALLAEPGASVAGRAGHGAGRVVTVGAGHDDLELAAVLASVLGVAAQDGATPEDTLDDSGRGGVGAVGTSVLLWVS